ncbi:MAG TPA: Nif11-like leader peptide family RiPP precursor [Acidimicrobiales bacterium]|nr:Nif11-like leader peptide family RiPP precursor [Acidimicrobiales bacterium]
MSQEAAKAFAERLKTDEAFTEELAKASTPEERLRRANEAGYEVTADDIDAIRSDLGIEELSDEDLEKVAGGLSDAQTVEVLSYTIPATAAVSALI